LKGHMYTRRRIYRKRWAKPLLLFLACGCIGLIAFLYLNRDPDTDRTSIGAELFDKLLPFSAEDVRFGEESRLVYPYSVIPGGVRSEEELAAYIATDKVVADHYRDFMVPDARIVKADETRMMHVSYRVGDKVYWTKKTVKIPEGELLITDGDCQARVRCGNRVSASPMEPVADEEPMTETFDIPKLAKMLPPKLPAIPNVIAPRAPLFADLADPLTLNPDAMPEYYPLSSPGAGVVPIAGVGSPSTPVVPPVDSNLLLPDIPPEYMHSIPPPGGSDYVVPEPGILTLLVTGLAALFAFRFLSKK
jgi:hypothetical protein